MAWIATDKDGKVYLYQTKPKREVSIFSDNRTAEPINESKVLSSLFEGFQFPKWEDGPIEIKITNNYILLS